jgi:cobaltochelatase CobT
MSDQTPLEHFKSVLTGTARALAHEPEVELAFTADAPSQAGKNFKVPMPGRSLPPEQVAEARGFADSFALKLKHHDVAAHMARRPAEAIAGAAFDAVENARVEALGSRNMAGVAANLGHALDLKLRTDPISRAQAADEVPISTALSLIVRERLTGNAVDAGTSEPDRRRYRPVGCR